MKMNSYPNLTEICRLCLRESKYVLNIFNSELSIPLRIMACTTLEVKESDNIPPNVCKCCRIQLERFYLFRKKCQSADIKLRKHIRLINSGKVSKVFCKKKDEDEEDDDDDDCINSQKFIEAYEKEEEIRQNKEKIELEQEIRELMMFDKYTQTESETVQNNFTLINNDNEKSMKNFINKSTDDISHNLSDTNDSTNKNENEKEFFKVDEDDDDEIIFVIEKDCSDEENIDKEHLKELNVYIEEEDESLILKNSANDTNENQPTESIDESSDFIDLIENSSVLEEEENLNTFYDVIINENEMNMSIKNDEEDNSVEKQQEHNISNENNICENRDAKLFKCHICPQSFSRIFLLDKHLNLHKMKKTFVCTVCRKHFSAKSCLERHSRIHNGEKPYKCDICGKAFIQNEILKRHRYLHFDKKPFACNHCDQAFIQKNLLQQHIMTKHSDNPIPKMFSCDICPKAFVHSSGLSRHLLLHTGMTYSCSICKKKFTDKSSVKRHTETHFKVRS